MNKAPFFALLCGAAALAGGCGDSAPLKSKATEPSLSILHAASRVTVVHFRAPW